MERRMINANVPAEIAVIGAALLGNPSGLIELEDQDFTDYRTKTVATVIRDMLRAGRAPDPIQVNAELQRRGKLSTSAPGLDSAWVADIAAPKNTPMAASAHWYAEAVRLSTRLRVTQESAQRLARAANSDGASDELAEVIAAHAKQLENIPPELNGAAAAEPATIGDLLKMELNYDWLIPGLVERGERIVLVASEGGGKSVLTTQWAIAMAGGCHPFTGNPIGEPKRVLLVDTENGLRQTQRRYDWIGRRFPKAIPGWANRIQHHIRTEGLDLPGRDRSWFMNVAAACSPDLIIVGPAYKVMRGDPQRDNDVMALINVLDEVRTRHNAVIMVETHTGHGKDTAGQRVIRPYGSSVWLRWPEVGIGLARSDNDQGGKYATEYEVKHWRGAREERDWPELIERGTDDQLPWSPVGTDYWTTVARRGRTQ
jgi:hypothetical protein